MNQKIVTLIAILTAFFSAYMFIDSRYALSGNLKAVELRLEHKVLSDRLGAIQQRIWRIGDRYEGKVMPDTTKEEYRILKEDKKQLNERIKIIIKQQPKGGK